MTSTVTSHDYSGEEFSDELQPGTNLLHGQYVIKKFLASGGFGITYLATDSLDRLVVIKECYPETICRRTSSKVHPRSRGHATAYRTMVDLFIEEARKLSRLSHPNIVGVHQVFEDFDTAYMALDYVDGQDLLEVAESAKKIQPEALERMVLKILDAIDFIHAQGLLHRDIAPDNILLNNQNEPILIDFGAARETVTRATRIIGALQTVKDGYSPNEFYVTDADQFPSSDLYSLAASLYHVMTKRLPPNAQERLSAIAGGDADPYVPISGQVDGYSPDFLKCIDQALQVFPKDRIQSAKEWRSILTASSVLPISKGAAALADPNTQSRTAATSGAGAQTRTPAKSAAGQAAQQPRPADEMADTFRAPRRNWGLVGVSSAAVVAALGIGIFFATGSDPESAAPIETAVAAAAPAAPTASPVLEPAPAETPDTPSIGDSPVQTAALDTPEAGLPLTAAPDTPAALAPAADSAEPTPVVALSDEITPIALPEPAEVLPQKTASDEIENISNVITASVVEFPVLPNVNDPTVVLMAGGAIGDQVEPGQKITTVNGVQITSLNDVPQIISDTSFYTVGDDVTVTLGVENIDTGIASIQDITLPAVKETTIPNGVQFHTKQIEGNWVTTVTNGSGNTQTDLLAGDRIVAFMPTNEAIDSPNAIADIVRREIDNGATRVNFAVNRKDNLWFVTMQLASSLGN